MTDTSLELEEWLPQVCEIAYNAGLLISKYYHQNVALDIERKADGTPVTVADKVADDLICLALKELTPDIPLITEESVEHVPFEKRQAWSTYWLVDPLDGTKEFIANTGEYSVNIALIHNHRPVLGVVYGTELGNMYFAYKHQKHKNPKYKHQKHKNKETAENSLIDSDRAAKISNLLPIKTEAELDWQNLVEQAVNIQVATLPDGQSSEASYKVAVSRRHGGELQRFMAQLGYCSKIKMGSALKTCLVAEGKADIYPRFGPTSLWDTAAAQCILEVAGGAVLNAAGHPLEYIQTESLLNPFFIAVSHKDHNWPAFAEVM
ncbi:3'(2'),5'-bisphosphate nucleotidase CysQ [Thiomicrorhabdus sp. Milos-T2]|uniref:3'(2'),5'-bisphosphate nucleotidase CysQ family protein n=1 Tax=Thiomicrorhabdus sp. Milos-T2 TaxID=90814 RepID=UPI00049404AA|nr:inositol monophosphatase family protein [Thiomicrorhabdus sp. Milos-T2]